jgi:ribonuclease J
MLFCSYFQLNELIDVNPVPGSNYLRSITEPFNDEMKLDSERILNWLNLFDLTLFGLEKEDKLHASGHASGTEVFDMLKKLQPKRVIPIHTENPMKFQESNQNILFVEQGKVIPM